MRATRPGHGVITKLSIDWRRRPLGLGSRTGAGEMVAQRNPVFAWSCHVRPEAKLPFPGSLAFLVYCICVQHMGHVMAELTPRQQEIYDFVRGFLVDNGMPPTRVEIARALGFRSANAAEDHLRALARKGVVELLPGASRGIRLLGMPGDESLPVVGRVAAGSPILAQEHIEDYFYVDPRLFRPRADYLLRVKGMSMRDAGILNGDLLVVHRSPDVTSGQIAVVRLDDEVTVKRFRRRGRMVRLLPENPDFEPIVVDLRRQALVIEGIGVGVIRNGKMT